MGRSVDEDAAIKIVAYECGEFAGLAKEIEKQIKALPSAQPERNPGAWILGEWDGYADGYPVAETLICSECGYEIAAINESRFCPNCGSEMTEEINDTD